MTAIAERQPPHSGCRRRLRTGVPTRAPSYWPFVLPAVVVVGSVIVFPWVFTIWMSLHEWTVGGARSFVGLSQLRAASPPTRASLRAVWHTLVYTFLAVILPLVLGTLAALVFNAASASAACCAASSSCR